jgi:hypothetical protein
LLKGLAIGVAAQRGRSPWRLRRCQSPGQA